MEGKLISSMTSVDIGFHSMPRGCSFSDLEGLIHNGGEVSDRAEGVMIHRIRDEGIMIHRIHRVDTVLLNPLSIMLDISL